ncbi:MAG: calcium-translocating P-type ATPase, PMCA-type [Clostridia bacterium]|nr:calcium-translocating P-type ATPase, PMCA-type [Clostridia bacterium]
MKGRYIELKFYQSTEKETFEALKTSERGISSQEAQKRLASNGKNKLKEAKKVPLIKRFLEQLADPMLIILIVAAVISGITTVINNIRHPESAESAADVIIIMVVVLINAILGVYQENKAEKAIEALQKMTAAQSKVIRDGKLITIKSEDIVLGDIIVLEAGDAVPADCRIIESASLKIEEAALTGESVPVSKQIEILTGKDGKDIPLGDRKNMAYMGSTVVYGRGKAVVCACGMNTEMGKIADALAQAEDEETPLQKKLGELSKILTYLVVGICAFIFVFGVIKEGNWKPETILNTFMIAVSLAVAAIPEGLAAVVTIVLSMGVTKMSKRNAVIRKLTAVETLGCAQVICSDKTGTLTQNIMTVVEFYSENEQLLAASMALSSDAKLDGDKKIAVGEPTECALVNYAYKCGLDKNDLEISNPRVTEAPFDSMRKMMSTVHKSDGGYVQYTKGAPDEVLKRCSKYLKDGHAEVLTDEIRKTILFQNKSMADKALRVLASAFKAYTDFPESSEPEYLEKDLCFIGLVGMIDPIRPEVVGAIEECKMSGIRTVMITGDHKDTAVAIAKELGIIKSADEAILGSDLDSMSDEELKSAVKKYSVYARVQPEHKVRIVNCWKQNGFITAMTGDGVNDAPSIKSADIGVGMGITGTDVTKNVADMVLADDNFATIVGAVEEGRRIYDNIRKSVQFLLASNMSEVISIFTATLLGFTILEPVHLLWINLITDCFPALALGMEKGEPDIMSRPPRSSKAGIFSGGVGFDIAYQGVLTTLLTLCAYFVGHYMESGVFEITNSADGTTMAFLTMSMAEIFHSFNMRSQRGSVFKLPTQNILLWGSMALSLILTTGAIYIPFLSEAFRFEHISIAEYAVAMGIAISIIPIVELVKFIQRKKSRK